MNVKLQLLPATQIVRNKGLSKDGDVQRFHTANILRRIIKYMPYRTGETIKITVAQTNINKPQIVTDVPYARFLYYWVVMVGLNRGSAYARR